MADLYYRSWLLRPTHRAPEGWGCDYSEDEAIGADAGTKHLPWSMPPTFAAKADPIVGDIAAIGHGKAWLLRCKSD